MAMVIAHRYVSLYAHRVPQGYILGPFYLPIYAATFSMVDCHNLMPQGSLIPVLPINSLV